MPIPGSENQRERIYDDQEIDQVIVPSVFDYINKRRKWFKAMEVLTEIVAAANSEDLVNKKEVNSFRH